jgi:DNA-binding transcriptional LysR family regulator
MAKAAEALVRTSSGDADEERGAVRLTASEHIGVELLTPLLPAFLAEHPRVAVELLLSSRTEDLVRRAADVAVRLVRPTQGALVARRLGTLGVALHAHLRTSHREVGARARSPISRSTRSSASTAKR